MQATCLNCQKTFEIINNARGKFCSIPCYNAFRELPNDRYRMVEYVDLVCDQCGTAFSRRLHEAKRSTQHFCSRSCAAKSNSWKAPNAKPQPPVTKQCEVCGKDFSCKGSHADRRRFCSRLCVNTHRSHGIGQENPNYRHGKNQTSAQHIALAHYPPRCIICGWDVIVEVHHIAAKSEGGTNDPINLAVLCPNHHRMAQRGMIPKDVLLSASSEAIIIPAQSSP